jgi:heme/copper-type cytochrome/quinol oxidase subunit 3
MGLSINDSVYSSVFFFLTGLHFFHLVVGLLLLSLLSWSSSFSFGKKEDLGEGEAKRRRRRQDGIVILISIM